MYDCLRVFLVEYHPYRRDASAFNGKRERTQRPGIATPTDWNRTYDTKKEMEMAKLFDSNGEPTFIDPKFFDAYVEKIPIR
jgi:hypothetical protein